jgi:excinuclease ABC subunit A
VDTLYKHLALRLGLAVENPGFLDGMENEQLIERVVLIDQSPIGRTPRSNPATYTKVFDEIRSIFASLPESRMRGWTPGRFSFNVPGGRCEKCQAMGKFASKCIFCPMFSSPARPARPALRFEHTEVKYRGCRFRRAALTVQEAMEGVFCISCADAPPESALRLGLD